MEIRLTPNRGSVHVCEVSEIFYDSFVRVLLVGCNLVFILAAATSLEFLDKEQFRLHSRGFDLQFTVRQLCTSVLTHMIKSNQTSNFRHDLVFVNSAKIVGRYLL